MAELRWGTCSLKKCQCGQFAFMLLVSYGTLALRSLLIHTPPFCTTAYLTYSLVPVADLEIFKGECKPPRATKLPTLGESGGMLPQGNFVILMLLKWSLKHLEHISVV